MSLTVSRLKAHLAKLGLQTQGGVYAWAARPSAVGRLHDIIHIDDIGPNGAGSFWYSDGARWRPINNATFIQQLLAPLAYPAASTAEIIMAQYLIPAGLLAGDADILKIAFGGGKTGAAGTIVFRVRVGALGTLVDPIVTSMYPAASILSFGGSPELQRISATTMKARGAVSQFSPMGAVTTGAAPPVVTVPNLNDVGTYVSFTAQLTSALDTLVINEFTLELALCGS